MIPKKLKWLCLCIQGPGFQFREICKTVLKLVGKMMYQFNSIKFENCRTQQLGTVISTVLAKDSLRTAKPFWSQRLTNQIASLNNSVKKFLTWIHRFFLTELCMNYTLL